MGYCKDCRYWKNPKTCPYRCCYFHRDYFKMNKIIRGYVFVFMPKHPFAKKGYIQQHRLIVEAKIGRYLTPEEVVHHLNEMKTDNRIENLMLFKNNREHIKFHTKLKQFGMTGPIRKQIENRWKEYEN